jgi:hypothetical protein
VLRVRGKQVQIGIEAPRSVRVLRAEVPAHEPPGAKPLEETPIRMAGPKGESASWARRWRPWDRGTRLKGRPGGREVRSFATLDAASNALPAPCILAGNADTGRPTRQRTVALPGPPFGGCCRKFV